MWLELCTNLILDLLQMKHLTNGNQWNESLVVTKTHVFDRIYIRTALFRDITQRVVVIPCRRFGKPIGPTFNPENAILIYFAAEV